MRAAAASAISAGEAVEAIEAAARERGDKEAIFVKGACGQTAEAAWRVRELVLGAVLAIKARQARGGKWRGCARSGRRPRRGALAALTGARRRSMRAAPREGVAAATAP